ncbi:MAG: hypothetical protein R3C60_02600 [Parvularculaceae bacterium]
MLRLPAKALFVTVTILLAGTPATASEATNGDLTDWRKDLMASRKYERACKRYNRPNSQNAAAADNAAPKVICRIPPVYPEKCMSTGHRRDIVSLVYDVTPDGYVENVRATHTTNKCLVQAAADSVYLYKYEQSDNGAVDIPTNVTFQLQ